MNTEQEGTRRLEALRIVKERMGYEVIRLYGVGAGPSGYRLLYHRPHRESAVTGEDSDPIAWTLFTALVDEVYERLHLWETMNEYKDRLDKIEQQRAKWRDRKRKTRRSAVHPARYAPAQTSIYGDDHVAELLDS